MLTADTRLPWQTLLHPHTDTPVASEQLLQPRDATDKTTLIAGTLEMSYTKCQQVLPGASAGNCHISFGWQCNMSITQGHCLGGRAAHCSRRDHQQDVPVGHFAVQEIKGPGCSMEYSQDHSTFPLHPYIQSVEPSHPLSRAIGTDLQKLSLSLSTFSSLLLP